jgi:hypothetical protein
VHVPVLNPAFVFLAFERLLGSAMYSPRKLGSFRSFDAQFRYFSIHCPTIAQLAAGDPANCFHRVYCIAFLCEAFHETEVGRLGAKLGRCMLL